MGFRLKTASFHAGYGPDILFERVRFIMGKVTELTVTKHFLERAAEREIPAEVLEAIKTFRPDDWKLISCDIRTDTGKFVKSTWEACFGGTDYRLVIGLGDSAVTIIRKDADAGSGKRGAVRGGELYDFVGRVNQGLMNQESSRNETT